MGISRKAGKTGRKSRESKKERGNKGTCYSSKRTRIFATMLENKNLGTCNNSNNSPKPKSKRANKRRK